MGVYFRRSETDVTSPALITFFERLSNIQRSVLRRRYRWRKSPISDQPHLLDKIQTSLCSYDVLTSLARYMHQSDLLSLLLTCKVIHAAITASASTRNLASLTRCAGNENLPCMQCNRTLCKVSLFP